MKTPICEMFDIEFPLIAFTHCRDVVVAVSKAGGMGVFGAVAHPPDRLEEELFLRTDRRHVGEIARERIEIEARHGAGRPPHLVEVVADGHEARDDGVGRSAPR